MNQQQSYDELKELAEQMGLSVRVEMGDFEGGLCMIKDRRVILLNRRHMLSKRISVMARALSQSGLGDIFIKPALREVIEEEASISPDANNT